jgi:hypothetical protein
MEVNTSRPGTEAASLTASALQNVRFKERRLREAESDVRNDAVYFSPVVRIDSETNTAILQYRNSETGEVLNQYPNKRQLDSYEHAKVLEQPEKAEVKVEDESV